MAPKKQQKKQQKKGVDFTKIKRKIGRKLPPPKNATNIEIKSKAIILPEQSVASEKVGLAVNKKGLTLKELLQQTSHHNAKVRKDAVLGIRDLLNKYPAELNLHKYAIIEKLRERISDDDNLVRGTLYELFKTVIFPGCKEDTQGVCVSLLTTYIFKAMMDLAIEVRLMAFKLLDLVVSYYPNSFFLHADKILQNYEDLFRINRSYLHEKGKLTAHLDGLVRCLSLLPCHRRADSYGKKDAEQKLLFAFDSDLPTENNDYSTLIPKVKDVVQVLVDCFVDFIPSGQGDSPLNAQSFDCMMCLLQSIVLSIKFFLCFAGEDKLEQQFPCGKTNANVGAKIISNISEVLIKRLLVLFPINSILQLSGKADERYFTLNKAIAEIYLHLREWISGPAVSLEIYLEFIERTLLGKMSGGKSAKEKHLLSFLPFLPKLVSVAEALWKSRLLQAFTTAFLSCNPESSLKLACLTTINEMLFSREDTMYPDDILDYHISWIRELPTLLIKLGDNHQSSSQDVLCLLLKLGQCAPMNPSIAWEFDNLQISLQPFFTACLNNGTVSYGPFVRLPSKLQELSLCCVCYFSYLDLELLKSISHCCLCPDLDPSALLRIVEVLNSSYEAGRIQIADYISFLTTLLSSFRVYPDNIFAVGDKDVKLSNRQTLKSLSTMVCSYISQIGDNSVVLQIMEDIILDRISSGLPLENHRAMLRLLCTLDSKPTTLSKQSLTLLGTSLSKYLIDIAQLIPKEEDENHSKTLQYYTVPCYFMFDKSHELLQLVLRSFTSSLRRSVSENQNAKDRSGLLDALATILQVFCKDPKIRAMVSSFKEDVACVLQESVCLGSSGTGSILDERHNMRCAVDRLKIAVSVWA